MTSSLEQSLPLFFFKFEGRVISYSCAMSAVRKCVEKKVMVVLVDVERVKVIQHKVQP